MKLLIVDDSSVIRRSIERFLQSNGITAEYLSASNGEEAIEVFETHKPQVVTMDITMPEMDGLTCLEELLNRDPSVKILVISALADNDTAIEALTKGATGFVCKPFTADELCEAIQKLIDQTDFART